jgi:hypothetical protein
MMSGRNLLLVGALVSSLWQARTLGAQQPGDSLAQARDSLHAPADTLKRAVAVAPETVFVGDTIMVVEETHGLVWGDWYVSPEVGVHVHQVIERRGQLSGRTWLESAAPIRDLALGRPVANVQPLSFLDKGVALNFWEPGEIDYRYVFEGPWELKARGSAAPQPGGATSDRVQIWLPVTEPPQGASLEARDRVGRLDIAYRTRTRDSIPRGRFTVYLYYLNRQLGYRIVGVGY